MQQLHTGELSGRRVPKTARVIVAGRKNVAAFRIEFRGIDLVVVAAFESGSAPRHFPQGRDVGAESK